MPTPNYSGQGQPQPNNDGGWFSRLGSYFGARAPVYATAAPATPAAPPPTPPDPKADAPIAMPVMVCPIDPAALASGEFVLVIPSEAQRGGISIDPDALAAGQIAIVIPRNALDGQ